ncbi:transcriptional regulator [Lysinibacillus sp. fkY74-1]|nr:MULTISPECIES: transcriptional regulator [Lysinibacillus]MBE5083902.1 transcriptional regulator [Bacillus thuringiensis]UZM97936.1 transcriptional regulator [Lysinibacillus sp. MHQ-1]AMO33316.1 transcriptional regulator [Lysinibacillus sphaericus]AMR91581.1 transcriptional regulator [Lysinibacillus sphaericus]ANA45628.1 transcriptional regulator [Lysinibacillus sphaericus]
MREQLIKAMQRNQLVDIMYIAKNGSVTKRRVRVIKIVGDSLQAFCFTRQAKRSFIIQNILAVTPVFRKEREVV